MKNAPLTPEEWNRLAVGMNLRKKRRVSRPPFKCTSGLREDGFSYERKDCTVLALANAGAMSYKDAHGWLKLAGRRDKHGAHPEHAIHMASRAGCIKVKSITVPIGQKANNRIKWIGQKANNRIKWPTLASLWPLFQPGKRYYLCTREHAFAIVDRTVLDFGPLITNRSLIQDIWEVEPLNPNAPVEAPVTKKLEDNFTMAELAELFARLDRIKQNQRWQVVGGQDA